MIQILSLRLQPMGGSSQHLRPWSKLGRSWSRFYPSDSSQWEALLNTTVIDPNLVAMFQVLPFTLQPIEGSFQHYRQWSKLGRPWFRFYHLNSSPWKALFKTTDIDQNLVGQDSDFTQPKEGSSQHWRHWSKLGGSWSRFYHAAPANRRLFSILQTLIQTW